MTVPTVGSAEEQGFWYGRHCQHWWQLASQREGDAAKHGTSHTR